MATETLSHSQSMIRLFMGYIPTRVIYVAAKLGLADHIRDDGATAQDLAQTLNKGSRLLLTHNSASATSLPWLDLYASNTQGHITT